MNWFLVASSVQSRFPRQASIAMEQPFAEKFPGVMVDDAVVTLQDYLNETHPDLDWIIERNIVGNIRVTVFTERSTTRTWQPE